MKSDERVRLFAEEPEWFLPESSPPSRRIRDERYTISLGPTAWLTFVSGIRVDARALAGTIAEIREQIGAAGHRRSAWTIGPSSRPRDLGDRLRALGFTPADQPPLEPSFAGMALTAPPVECRTGVAVHKVDTLDDFRIYDRIMFAGSGVSAEEIAEFQASVLERWDAYVGRDVQLRFLAQLDGEPVAAGQLFPCPAGGLLGGSTTLPAARGRGAYRALVQARWEEMVARGAPALVIQAGAMSAPILERVGFRRLFQASVLLDPAA